MNEVGTRLKNRILIPEVSVKMQRLPRFFFFILKISFK